MSNENGLDIQSVSNYWRNTARSVKVFGINGFIVLPFLVLIFRPRMWSLYLFIATIIVLFVMERFGYTPIVAFRTFRSRAGGVRVTRNRRIGNYRIWK